MGLRVNHELIRKIGRVIAEKVLPQLAGEIIGFEKAEEPDLDKAYRMAVQAVVETLLAPGRHVERAAADSPQRAIDPIVLGEIGLLSPEEVGSLYEYLRGFKLKNGPGTRPELVPSVCGKRNQGLFYTPDLIVTHIVSRALDALEISNPVDYLRVRILDPAVGTGIFLAEALDQVSSRVLSLSAPGEIASPRTKEEIGPRMKAEPGRAGTDFQPDEQTAVRIHVLEHCLYGVDLDPIAVAIARSVLLNRVMGDESSVVPRIQPKVRVGNALMGTGRADPTGLSRGEEDRKHAALYSGKRSEIANPGQWSESNKILHWPLEFPEIFSRNRPGFDLVIGNPPYEIVSVKESGIQERRREQAYYRKVHKTCHGKINTYRLMLERGLDLLRDRGTLGFIVPATLLADSTARKLREMILRRSQVLDAVVIPEKARVFEGVTQAYLILLTRKGKPTDSMAPVVWDGRGAIPVHSGIEVGRRLIERMDNRIPTLGSSEEKALLESLTLHPPLGGDSQSPGVARVHQGEINLTVHREFITEQRTAFPLVRGEHVFPFNLMHPSSRHDRLDWVVPAFAEQAHAGAQVEMNLGAKSGVRSGTGSRGRPWEEKRIVLGRVVNMDTYRRLKAAAVPSGFFLGDMTNFLTDINVPFNYLLGLLNSSLLNWRIKLTSTNNYLSAAEILALPMPRPRREGAVSPESGGARERFNGLADTPQTVGGCVQSLRQALGAAREEEFSGLLSMMVEWTVESIVDDCRIRNGNPDPDFCRLLDAAVLLLYGVEDWSVVLDK